MGPSQLNFSIMYYMALSSSELVLHANYLFAAADVETVCIRPTPKYELGNKLFSCSEDMEEPFPIELGERK